MEVSGTDKNVCPAGFCDQICPDGAGAGVVYPDRPFILFGSDGRIWHDCRDFDRRDAGISVLYGGKYSVELLFRLRIGGVPDVYFQCKAYGKGVLSEIVCPHRSSIVQADSVSDSVCDIFSALALGGVERDGCFTDDPFYPSAAFGDDASGSGMRQYHCGAYDPLS